MNAHHIHDAIGEISEELIDPVAKLRQKKRYPVAKWVAAAACVCLALLSLPIGLSAFDGTKAESADRAPEMNMGHLYGGVLDDEKVSSDMVVEMSIFRAKVLEVHENTVLVEPLEGEDELRCSDQIYISFGHLEQIPEIKVDDIIQIQYNGMIMESYPAQIDGTYSIEIIE